MKAGMIKQCGNCSEQVDEKWTKIDEHGIHICPYCGVANDFSENDAVAEEYEKFRNIYINLDNLQFDTANNDLENLRQLYPNSSQVYFLSVLAENCVCYTPDGENTGRRIPTLNDLPNENLLETAFAKKALDLAESEMIRESYLETFNYIEKVRQEIKRDASNPEYQYDIFLSTKVTQLDENGNVVKDADGEPKKSPDYKLAYELYNYIRDKNPRLRVFFSDSADAKEKMAGLKYENVIFSALHSARAFILICESRDSIEWRWVRNEWKRYLRIMKREKPGDRNFVLWTKSLKESDIPSEIRNLNYINGNLVNAGEQLKSFLNRALGKKENVQKLKSSTFTDTEVDIIAPVEIEDDIQLGGGLKTTVAEASADIKAEIARITLDLDPDYPEARKDAFRDLEELLKENPDVYEAKKLMLLKDTNYINLDAYLNNPNEVIKNPKILADFLEFASVEDGKKSLVNLTRRIANEHFYFDYSVQDALVAANIRDWSEKLSNALNDIILKYLNDIEVKDLRALRNRLANTVKSELNYDTKPQEEIIKSYLTLSRYINGKDTQSYIDSRKEVILSFERFYPDKAGNVAKIQKTLVEEILKVNPGEYNTVWMDFCLRRFANPYNSANGIEEFISDIKTGRIELSTVNDKETLGLFETLFKYSRKEERALYMYAFLTLIICDKRTYEQQEITDTAEGATSLSEENGDGKKEDYQLDGVSLFTKYISYPLPNVTYPSTLDDKFDEDSPLLTPNVNAYLKKKKPTPLDNLLCTFAVTLHKKLLFDDANKFYDLYLDQQASIQTLDCLLIRFYRELANVRVPETEDLKHIGQVLQHKDIDRDIVALQSTLPCAMAIYKKIKRVSDYQRQYFDTYQAIKILADRLPRERTIEKVELITKTRDDIIAKLNSLNDEKDKAVKNELKHDFKAELDFFDKKLPDLIEAANQINKMFADNNTNRIEKSLTEGYRDTEMAYRVAKKNAEKMKKTVEGYDNPGLKKAHLATLNTCLNNIHSKMLADAHRRKAKRFFGGLFTFIFAFMFPIIELLIPFEVVMSFVNGQLSDIGRIVFMAAMGTTVLHQFFISFINPEKLKYGSGRAAHHISRVVSLIAALFLVVYSFPFMSVLLGGFEFYDNLNVISFFAAILIFIILIVRMYRNKDGDAVSTNVGGLSYIFLRILLLIVPAFAAIMMFSGWGACFTSYMGGCENFGDCSSCSCACFGIDCYLSESGLAYIATPDLFSEFNYFSPAQITLLFVGMVGIGIWSLVNVLTHTNEVYDREIPRPYMRIASILTIIVCALYVLLGGLALLNGLLATTCQACTFFCFNCGCGSCGCFGSSDSYGTPDIGSTCAFSSNQTNLLIGLGFAALGGLNGAANIIEQRN